MNFANQLTAVLWKKSKKIKKILKDKKRPKRSKEYKKNPKTPEFSKIFMNIEIIQVNQKMKNK